jgi:hypothetical protein
MVVVTLVVTARGVLDVPPVTNWPTLRKALQQVRYRRGCKGCRGSAGEESSSERL